MHGFNGMNWGMGFGWIIGIAVVILIIWIITRTVNGSPNTPSQNNKSALDILNERYAKGEIDDKEYEEKANRLKQS